MGKSVTFLGVAGNYSLVQIEGRKFPALAIQGDSVKVLHDVVSELTEALAVEDAESAAFAAREIAETVASMVTTFEALSEAAGRPLPY